MTARNLTKSIVPAALAAIVFSQPLAAESMSAVYRFADGSAVEGSSSVLTRSMDGVSTTFLTTATPGDAYTIWWVVFNDPEHCTGGVCDDDDVLPPPGNVQAGVSVLYASGRVADMMGKAEFGARLKVGDTSGAVFGPGLMDSVNAEIHVVLRTHGQAMADPTMLHEQISTFNGGCPPSDCVDEQFAVHQASQDRALRTMEEMRSLLQRMARRMSIEP